MGEVLVFKPVTGHGLSDSDRLAHQGPAPKPPAPKPSTPRPSAVVIFFPGVRRGTIVDRPSEAKGRAQGDRPQKKTRRKQSQGAVLQGKDGVTEKQKY
ncbi:hypothetical protein SAMN05444581_10455 [Methylocapsa palsarum]|uniref:Uncharacterized protein n=1 Tax=Methylocapsa palsarum TaxID=1612308 RepID=A0A1I3XSN7_9HYPH|nr:hypothetical protein SAMN05444581_10455 [Methylocapsa palsarum]